MGRPWWFVSCDFEVWEGVWVPESWWAGVGRGAVVAMVGLGGGQVKKVPGQKRTANVNQKDGFVGNPHFINDATQAF